MQCAADINATSTFVCLFADSLQLKRVGRVKAISPLCVSRSSLKKIGLLPDHINHRVNSTCVSMLAKLNVVLTEQDKARVLSQTVRQIGDLISK